MIMTCQICARNIKSSKGLIAHHGYKRPGQGWQTSSCGGARHLPYEISCDAIRPVINLTESHRDNVEKVISEWSVSPPETITEIYPYSFYNKHPPVVYSRPEGFDGKDITPSYRPNNYEHKFKSTQNDRKRQIKEMNEFINFLKKRLDDWDKLV